MPLEQDAWATGGLVEKYLGLTPSTPDQELDHLDKDERSMIPIQFGAMAGGSAQERALAAVIGNAL